MADNILTGQGFGKITRGFGAQIIHLRFTANGGADIVHCNLGRADKREIALIRNGKNNPPIVALEKVTFIVGVEPFGDDMTALNQPNFGIGNRANIGQNTARMTARGVY